MRKTRKVGDFTALVQGLECAGAGKCEFAAQYRSLAGWSQHEMLAKVFGNRTVLDIGVSSDISHVNESSGIVNNKSFGVLRVLNVVANPVPLKVKTGGAVFAVNNAYSCDVVTDTFFLPVEDNNVIINRMLEHVLAVRFPRPKRLV